MLHRSWYAKTVVRGMIILCRLESEDSGGRDCENGESCSFAQQNGTHMECTSETSLKVKERKKLVSKRVHWRKMVKSMKLRKASFHQQSLQLPNKV